MIRRWIIAGAMAGITVSASAQPIRTLLVEERMLPKDGAMEVGIVGVGEDISLKIGSQKIDFETTLVLAPYVRYGVTDLFAVRMAVPFVRRSPEFTGSENGLGDIQIGAELVVYEDIFRYPWIKPYVNVSLPTGSENAGLGSGNTDVTAGIAIGTQMYDYLGFVLDTRYEILRDDNRFSLGGSMVWDLSDQFSMLAEVRSYEETDVSHSSVRFLGGMIYWPTPQWMVGVYGGQHRNGFTSSTGAVKISYLLP